LFSLFAQDKKSKLRNTTGRTINMLASFYMLYWILSSNGLALTPVESIITIRKFCASVY